jgi:hypothetical protein
VRPFSRPCDDFPICADTFPLRASHLSFRAAKNPSVRRFSDLCEQKAGFLTILLNSDGQKTTI